MSDLERFWSKVDKSGPTDCWPWTGHRHERGYGIFWFSGKNIRANRFALEATSGAPPFEGAMALHSCHNPPCCNPNHLRWGTALDNTGDQIIRFGPLVGENSRRSQITDAAADKILHMRMEGYRVREIASELDLQESLVENVYVGKSWAHRLGVDGNPTLEQLKAKRPHKTRREASNRVLTDDMVDAIFSGRMDGKTAKELATQLMVPVGTVSPVFSGLSFKERLGKFGNPTFEELKSVKNPHFSKLTEDDRAEILALLAKGAVAADVAKAYGVSPATISKLKKGA